LPGRSTNNLVYWRTLLRVEDTIREEVNFSGPKTQRRVYASHIEHVVFAVSRTSDPNSASTSSDNTLKPGYTTFDFGAFPRITPKLEEGVEDDIPVSIRNSFKELRSVKDELEYQVRVIPLFTYITRAKPLARGK
jgi:hypothetical protein